ncbi:flagellar basal-body MS-ring/collar protein FliF [Cellulomonas sp. ATA003]|uniref:flagellar basal-body MS-ring/collar protein FliF n=1 Tax=Cellulomonas sp. ATA003 TaxID=3073064 RepID=UPI002873B51A|nr:flagellar basal-body MS-ring/collar protein FliF [Cellulomonas sp. ATA003]WNB87004.1 flagellar basal-body MS-ring/collar protein FliF [Cellulomonas sp. ATA003]
MTTGTVATARPGGAAATRSSLRRRLFLLIGVAGLVLGLVALSAFLTRPTMSPLFADVSAADASAIVDQLDGEGVPYELTDGGRTILVPADRLYATRLKVAAAGLPASSDGAGYSLLDDMGMTASEFQQQTTYQRAMEGELAKTIGAINGVEAATVKLALPEESVFVSQTADPTASVFVKTARGTTLEPAQVQSIVHLVSAGVQNMKPTDVAVIDSEGRVLSAVGGAPAGGLSDQKTAEYERRVTSSVQAMLDRVVGPGKAVVTVNAELNLDNTDRTSESFTATDGVPPLASSTTREEYVGTGGWVGESTYAKSSETLNPAVDKTTELTIMAPGTVRRQSVSVVVDQQAGAALNMEEVSALVSVAAGIDPVRGDTIEVAAMQFDMLTAEAAQAELAAAAAESRAAEQAELIRTGVIAGAVLLALVIAFLVVTSRSRKSSIGVPDISELTKVEESPILPFHDGDTIAISAPRRAVNETAVKRAEIGALADEQPGEVADLLRSWRGSGRA